MFFDVARLRWVSGYVKRAFRYRFYPTEAQIAELARTFGCVRKVYNLALQARTEELAFLNEVSSVPLQQALRHLQAAFSSFWAERARHPRYKSKRRARACAEYTRSAFRWRDGVLTLAKMAEPLDIRWSRLCEDRDVELLPPVESAVGVDVGLEHLLVLSTGEKIGNPRHERRDRLALAKAQRVLSRRQAGSNNRAKARLRVGRVHARIADRRADHLHKTTTRLVRENQTLVIEDLAVSNMVSNRRLARAVSDAGWRQFRQMLEYKAAWYGRNVIVVDRWFPSAKLCSACGALASAMPLRVRTWTCDCGATHDRDVNAARNILAAGLAVTVCGAGVRPQRSTPGGRSVTKQKALRREPWQSPSFASGKRSIR